MLHFDEEFACEPVSLAIPPINAKLKNRFYRFMLPVKKKLSVLSVLFGLNFLFLSLVTNDTFLWIPQHVPPLLKAASHVPARVVGLDCSGKTDESFVFDSDDDPKPRSESFSTTIDPAQVFLRGVVVAPLFLRNILTPKVSRYISKSVFNL